MLFHYFQRGGYQSELKPDQSPVTEADLESDKLIGAYLKDHFPTIPIISEESNHLPFSMRSKWEDCWIIDPLDGTKEFMSGNPEFAINLAYLLNGEPVIGFIAIPSQNTIYFGMKGEGAFCLENSGSKRLLSYSQDPSPSPKQLRLVISRSHAGQEEENFIEQLRNSEIELEIISMGSSVKQMFMAEGKADLYPKLSRCWEWDTAPGQLILAEAGGVTMRMEDGQPLEYNKENLYNPSFLMWGPCVTPLPWQMAQDI